MLAPPALQTPGPSVKPVSLAQAAAALQTPGPAEDRVRRVVDLLHERLAWCATDYRSRTVEDILVRGMGNCADHARVLRAVLEAGGLKTRWIQEINLQAPSEARQTSARAKVETGGSRYSVFGRSHNDHRWLEVLDPATGAWFPADSSTGVVGMEAWVAARLGFGPRPDPVKEMIAPIFVEATDGGGRPLPLSRTYLIEAFGRSLGEKAQASPAWTAWSRAVLALEVPASKAFRGEEDLHGQQALLDDLARAYEVLRRTLAPG